MSNSDDDCEFIKATRDSFLTQHVSTPTRGRGTNVPSLIDLVFTSIEDSIDNISMHAPLGKSGHSLIKIIYRCKPVKQADKIVCNYVKADFNKMIEKLDINWETFFEDCDDDVDLAWDKCMRKYNEVERECIPRKVKNASVFLLIGKR